MKTLGIIIASFLLPLGIQAQETFTLSGEVLDSETQAPLYNSHVYIEDLNFGTTTDRNGKFEMKLPVSMRDRSLYISFMGYGTHKIWVHGNENHTLNIEMNPEPIILDELIIRPDYENIAEDHQENFFNKMFSDNQLHRKSFLGFLSDAAHNTGIKQHLDKKLITAK